MFYLLQEKWSLVYWTGPMSLIRFCGSKVAHTCHMIVLSVAILWTRQWLHQNIMLEDRYYFYYDYNDILNSQILACVYMYIDK